LPATTNGTTIYGSMEPGESNLNDAAGASVWYQWTAPSTGPSARAAARSRPA
jgi:hypothetical protein